MLVVVGSKNPVKLRATEAAFRTLFPDAHPELQAISVGSGVSDQPTSDRETRRGARTRVGNARDAVPTADFFVGFEGGVELLDETLMAFAWIAVADRAGAISEARTVTLPLPPAVRELLDRGIELGEANDRVFSTADSKRRGGAFGLLTGGIYTRESVYTEALVVALVPLTHELYSQ